MRYLIAALIIMTATFVFGWVGLVVGPLIAFGVLLFSSKRIRIDHSQPFFSSTNTASIQDVHFFELFGYLCKIDGVVSRDEIRGVEVIFDHLRFSPEERAAAIAGFNRGKQPDFNFEGVLYEVRSLNLPTEIAVQLIHLMNVVVANADGSGLVVEERNLLFTIGDAFGLTQAQIAEILMLGNAGAGAQNAREEPTVNTLQRAYSTLGFSETATPKEMSRQYRKLRSRNHPDKLSRSVSDTERTAAARRFDEIQRAWDIVRVHHGI
ncbi:MAG: TerB family tellurite resistance protein [Gammaproteobacteria bacterium]|nr:TerB family tellurite resistance protein [Gammaproteobacteria bacterium]